jgi:HEAT repeat protein
MKHHKEHPLVQQDPEEARRRIAHSLAFGQNPEEHKFITGQLLSGRYKPGEDDPTIQATLGNWRKLTKETRGMHQGKTLADHDHDSVSAIFRASSGETKSSKAKQSAGDLAKYQIGTIDGGEHGPLDVYHIHQDMVPEGEDVQEETVRFQGKDYKFNTEKPYIDFSKAIKRVCPPGSTICVQHAGAYVKNYSEGHGFFLYTNKDGQTVYAHGNADDGMMRHDNSVVKGQEAQNIKNQTGNLLRGQKKAAYALAAGSKDGIQPDVKLTDDEFDTALNHPYAGVRHAAVRSPHFGPQHVERALGDEESGVRYAAIVSPHFGPEHMDRALGDEEPGVRWAAVKSPHFGPQHVERALGDENPNIRDSAVRSPAFGPEQVERALGHENPNIRDSAVKSLAFGPQHMDRALNDPHHAVRLSAASSKHFGPQHVERALNDPHHAVRYAAVRSPHFGPQHIDRALADEHISIRELAVQSPHFGPQHMDRALGDEDFGVRWAAVKSPHFGPQHVERALGDDNQHVRRLARERGL